MSNKGRIVVAMSGGVDSSVTAALLHEEGWDVVGVTLKLYDQGETTGRGKTCCAGRDIEDARRVAERLGIPHYVIDSEADFHRDVMLPFADSYAKGETPIPCVACNRTVKFRDLLGLARELGAEALATGHYARREAGAAGPMLLRAADEARDQSYFLFATTRAQLDFLRFPLGGLADKGETRALAVRYGLDVADKPDSQDICFVPDGDYAKTVARLRPGVVAPGDIVDQAGVVLGLHEGVIHYTIGQRKGLGLGDLHSRDGEPLYVLRLDAPKRQVVVGPRAALGRDCAVLREVNWLGEAGGEPARVAVKIRSARPPVPAMLTRDGSGGAVVAFDEPEMAVAPGQACVFYDGARVLGGGWITGAQ